MADPAVFDRCSQASHARARVDRKGYRFVDLAECSGCACNHAGHIAELDVEHDGRCVAVADLVRVGHDCAHTDEGRDFGIDLDGKDFVRVPAVERVVEVAQVMQVFDAVG